MASLLQNVYILKNQEKCTKIKALQHSSHHHSSFNPVVFPPTEVAGITSFLQAQTHILYIFHFSSHVLFFLLALASKFNAIFTGLPSVLNPCPNHLSAFAFAAISIETVNQFTNVFSVHQLHSSCCHTTTSCRNKILSQGYR